MREAPPEELGIEAGRRWLALAPEHRADTLILAPTHAICRQANEAVREGLAEEGVLRGRTLAVERLVNRRLTRALASDIRSYEPGDTVVFHRDVFGCRASDVCIVMGHNDGRVVLAHPDGERRFRPSGNAAGYLGLYDTERIELRAGDRIRWTRNRKAPLARGKHSQAPDLVNGGEAEIVEIGYARVRFRDGEREFSIALTDPQLRHLDHAYCSTVHSAQGRTARGAIAVLDAGGWVDPELFHVELSRVSEAFLLLTDDREELIERLEAQDWSEDGALEALGIDLSEPPVVDPEVFAALAADWRALLREGEETNTLAFFLTGYRDVMARAAALAQIEDLPEDMRRLTGTMLAEHEGHLAHDREVRGLVERVRDHWRRWPELGWAASAQGLSIEQHPEHDTWREEGVALLEAGRSLVEAEGEAARRVVVHHLHAMPGARAGLEEAVEMLERTRLLDDAERFERAWHALREGASEIGVPELHAPGHRPVAELGERLEAAEGIDAQVRLAVAEWRKIEAAQAALVEEVRTLPGRIAAWRERRADLPQDEPGGLDPKHPARRAWREEGAKLQAVARDMLRPEDVHAPYLDAVPGQRAGIRQAAEEVRDALRDDRYRAFGCLNHTLQAWMDVHASIRELESALGRDTSSLHHQQPELYLQPVTRSVPTLDEAKDADASYRRLRDEWHKHVALAESTQTHPYHLEGHAALIDAMRELRNLPDLATNARQALDTLLHDYTHLHRDRQHIHAYLDEAEHALEKYQSFEDTMQTLSPLDVRLEDLAGYGEWKDRTLRLADAGEAILADLQHYRIHLKEIPDLAHRIHADVQRLNAAIGRDDTSIGRERHQSPSEDEKTAERLSQRRGIKP